MFRILSFFLLIVTCSVCAQTYYVDPLNGDDSFNGQAEDTPFRTLEKAFVYANSYSGEGTIHVKLFPGLYVATDKILLTPSKKLDQVNRFVIEAVVMPDDTLWEPSKMPIFQSISKNNHSKQFEHCVGLSITTSHVSIKGIKFIGNPNPDVHYYYPVSREDDSLTDLEVSQCFFIGDNQSSPIQGAIYTFGMGLNVDHCIIYGCRNGVLHFSENSPPFDMDTYIASSVKNCIINNANEGAFWTAFPLPNYEFRENVVSNCKYFWVKIAEDTGKYEIHNSVITNVVNFIVVQSRSFKGKRTVEETNVEEFNVIKSGSVLLINKEGPEFPKLHLHLLPQSAGFNLSAGVLRDYNSK